VHDAHDPDRAASNPKDGAVGTRGEVAVFNADVVLLGREQRERCVCRHMLEILVGRQQLKAVPNAQLGEKSIDRTNLDPLAPAHVPQLSRFNVVIDFRRNNGEEGEGSNDPVPRFGTIEPLKKFLQD
jgi:hypothetical protein